MTAAKSSAQGLKAEAEALAASLPALLVSAERLAATVSLGVHGRRKAGMGESFWQFRRYQSHDAANAIDWRQSSRSQHLFVREREWEAAAAVWLWRDNSPSMGFRSRWATTSKSERAGLLLLALAALLVRGGEKIALLGEDSEPGQGRKALTRAAFSLARSTAEHLPHPSRLTRHAQLVWFSDFLGSPSEIRAQMRRYHAVGVTGHLVHLVDPAEEDFPYQGRTRFEGMSQTDSQIVGRAESLRSLYQARFAHHGEEIAALARAHNWTYLRHRTDKPATLALIALYGHIGGAQPQHRAS